ncbi:hypothetical protein ACWD4T_03955 [Streptomyces umbrinus]
MADHPAQHSNCPDCGVAPGELHSDGCDTAHCPDTGAQRLMCDHDGACESRWSGDFAGAAECRAWGWWLTEQPGLGLVPCPPGTEGAIEDYNRLITHARWDADEQRYVRTDAANPKTA